MELQIVKFFNRLGRGTAIDSITKFISWIPFLTLLWAVLGVLFLFFDKLNGQKMFVAFAVGSALYFAINEGFFRRIVTRHIVKRTRPYKAYPNEILPIGREHGSTSFPSSHMTTTLFMLSIVHFYHSEFLVVSLIFIIFMAYARMHNGMHYLSDIFAGSVLGISYGLIAIYLAKQFF